MFVNVLIPFYCIVNLGFFPGEGEEYTRGPFLCKGVDHSLEFRCLLQRSSLSFGRPGRDTKTSVYALEIIVFRVFVLPQESRSFLGGRLLQGSGISFGSTDRDIKPAVPSLVKFPFCFVKEYLSFKALHSCKEVEYSLGIRRKATLHLSTASFAVLLFAFPS